MKLNTLQGWRRIYIPGSAKYIKLQTAARDEQNKGTAKQFRVISTDTNHAKFPSIDRYMCAQRKERVEKNRDRSMGWAVDTLQNLLNDPEKLESLGMTDKEKALLPLFKGTEGWVRRWEVFNSMSCIALHVVWCWFVLVVQF